MNDPAEWPPSEHALVPVRLSIVSPLLQLTACPFASIVPQRQPDVRPERQIAAPTAASVLPVQTRRLCPNRTRRQPDPQLH
jgi:hypothetical protein